MISFAPPLSTPQRLQKTQHRVRSVPAGHDEPVCVEDPEQDELQELQNLYPSAI